jgi:type IV secretory pathway TraG/TraD family ATPase VirD4
MVTDPKADAASLPRRIRKSDRNVTVLDPFKVTNGMARNRFNPLTLLDSDAEPITTEGD